MADVLNIHAYELLKPENILPDNALNVIEKYSDDMHSALEKTINKTSANCIKKLKK